MIGEAVATVLVVGIVAAEVVIPFAIVFHLGRRFERRSQRRAIAAGAERLLREHSDAAPPLTRDDLEAHLPLDPMVPLGSLYRTGGFPLSRRRRILP